MVSIKLGMSVAVVEIIFGIIIGNLGLIELESWMIFASTFGGVFLTFLSGSEVDINLMKNKFKESFLIGFISFLAPLIAVFILVYFILNWNLSSSVLIAIALSETSIAIVYSTLTEKNLFNKELGKLIMIATFITNLFTAIALNLILFEFSIESLIFYVFSLIVLVLAYKFSYLIFDNNKFDKGFGEVKIQYVLLLLVLLLFLASIGGSQAILPAFILGVLLSKYFREDNKSTALANHLKIIAFSIVNPIFFIVAGIRLSVPLVIPILAILILVLGVRLASKFVFVNLISRKYLKDNIGYTTLMMSTGLTFGLVVALAGLNHNIISQSQYSLITGILVLSAIVPTFLAQRYYNPKF